MTPDMKGQNVPSEGPPVPGRPIIVFDVNETLLNLEALRRTFDRISATPPPCACGSPT